MTVPLRERGLTVAQMAAGLDRVSRLLISFAASTGDFVRAMHRAGAAVVRLTMALMAIERQERGPRIGRKNMPGPPLRRVG